MTLYEHKKNVRQAESDGGPAWATVEQSSVTWTRSGATGRIARMLNSTKS